MNPSVSIQIDNDETKLHNASVYAGIAMNRFQADIRTDFEDRPRGRVMTVTFSGEQAELAAQYLQNLALAKGLFAMLISATGTGAVMQVTLKISNIGGMVKISQRTDHDVGNAAELKAVIDEQADPLRLLAEIEVRLSTAPRQVKALNAMLASLYSSGPIGG